MVTVSSCESLLVQAHNIEVSPEGYVYVLRLGRYIPSSGEDVGVPLCTGCIYLRDCMLYVYEYEREHMHTSPNSLEKRLAMLF